MRFLTRDEWEFYAELRTERGIERANKFKSKVAKKFPVDNREFKFKMCLTQDWDSWVEKVFIPHRHFTPEQKLELARDFEIKVNSPYDCSGQPFSWAVDVFNVAGGAWVYRHMGYDV